MQVKILVVIKNQPARTVWRTKKKISILITFSSISVESHEKPGNNQKLSQGEGRTVTHPPCWTCLAYTP